MRIGFDARMIDHPGIGRYIRNILREMFELSKNCEFILYGDPHKLSGFTNCHIRSYATPIYNPAEFLFSPFNRDRLDILHIPHFNMPCNIKRRKKSRRPKLITTIHDLIYIKFPMYLPFFKRIAASSAISNAVRRSDIIIAVSENTKRDIIDNFPDVKDKVRIIYEAADPIFRRMEGSELKERIRQKYDLPADFMLFVGSLRRHKNLEKLIDVYIKLKAQGIGHRLVIVGRGKPKEAYILKKIKLTDAIYLGEVDGDDLVVIYNLATLFILPSWYEGFGLPILEAMACGAPVLASSAASLTEVVGDAGLLFEPYDTAEDIANKIVGLLKDEELRQRYIQKGLQRVNDFSWKKAANKTLDIYKEALSY